MYPKIIETREKVDDDDDGRLFDIERRCLHFGGRVYLNWFTRIYPPHPPPTIWLSLLKYVGVFPFFKDMCAKPYNYPLFMKGFPLAVNTCPEKMGTSFHMHTSRYAYIVYTCIELQLLKMLWKRPGFRETRGTPTDSHYQNRSYPHSINFTQLRSQHLALIATWVSIYLKTLSKGGSLIDIASQLWLCVWNCVWFSGNLCVLAVLHTNWCQIIIFVLIKEPVSQFQLWFQACCGWLAMPSFHWRFLCFMIKSIYVYLFILKDICLKIDRKQCTGTQIELLTQDLLERL